MLNVRFKNFREKVTKTEKSMSDFTSIPHLIVSRLKGEGDYNMRIFRTEIEEQCNTSSPMFGPNKTGHRWAQILNPNNNMNLVYM